jgi:hypothetical protein
MGHTMPWSALVSVFLLSTIKFVPAPGVGWAAGLDFLQILAANIGGAWFACIGTYLFASWFMERSALRRARQEARTGKRKRAFTRMNRWIIRMKGSKRGFIVMVLVCPTFMSVPLGTLVVAKFYGHLKHSLPAMLTSLACWSVVFTTVFRVFDFS